MEAIFHMQYYMNTVSVTRWTPKFLLGWPVVTHNSPGFKYKIKPALMSQKYKSELYMIYHMITAQNLVILGF